MLDEAGEVLLGQKPSGPVSLLGRACHGLFRTCGKCRLILGALVLLALAVGGYRVRESAWWQQRMPFPASHTPPAELVRGVSLGGWLVLESFITPGLFDRANELSRSNGLGCPLIVDQWSIHECLGANASLALLAPHWDGWVTHADLLKLRATGLNTLRIPVPYWLVDIQEGEPWVGQAQMAEALGKVLKWSVELGFKVLVDLHAAPGSQNGFDNSGRVGHTDWQSADASGLSNVRRTLIVWQQLVSLLSELAATAGVSNLDELLAGLEVLNEAPCFDPQIDREVLRAFVVDAYFVLRGALKSDVVPIYFHDCFYPHAWSDFLAQPPPSLNSNGQSRRFVNLRLDRHEYQVQLLACEQAFSIVQNMQTHPTLVGEFSVAVNDCDRYLNGYAKGARFDGTPPFTNPPIGSCEPYRRASNFSPAYIAFLRQYAERQMAAWDVGLGWIYWNFKTEDGCAPHFDYLLGVAMGYLPPEAGVYRHACPKYLRRTMV
ncbi:glycoside hydrolase superfamily [Pavlovales sp. CCMP2436]|nr:glycoside hydrolase superfamily [Pavlovales sp. CCMP2436]